MPKNAQAEETSAQRAFADVAKQRLGDWSRTYAPLARLNAARVVAAGAPDSFQRRRASGIASTDQAAKFAVGTAKVERAMAARGDPGSSASKLAITGTGEDQAVASGNAQVAADQTVDDAYISNLGAVTANARGEKSQAVANLAGIARTSAAQAEADVAQSNAERASIGELAGTAGGIAYGQLMQPGVPDTGTGSVPGGYRPGGGDPRVFNNPSAYAPR